MATNSEAGAGRGNLAASERLRWGAKTPGELKDMGPPEWLIDGVIPLEGTGVIYGATGSYKTFLVLSMEAAIVTGTDWHGHTVKQGTVIHIVTEGYAGMGPRIVAWEQESGLSLDGSPLYVIREPVDLLKDAEKFAAHIKERYPDVRLIVFDTLSKSTRSGTNEIDAKEMSKAVAGAEIIARAVGAFGLMVHHATKSGKTARGSGALDADVDTVLRLERDKDAGTVKVTCEKQRDDDDGWYFTLRARKVDLGEKYPKGSLVLTGATRKAKTARKPARKNAPAPFDQVYAEEGGNQEAIMARMGLTPDAFRQRKSRMERAKRRPVQLVA